MTYAPLAKALHNGTRTSLTGVLGSALLSLARLGEFQPPARQLVQLAQLSDAQLAARGLKRDEVARKILADRGFH